MNTYYFEVLLVSGRIKRGFTRADPLRLQGMQEFLEREHAGIVVRMFALPWPVSRLQQALASLSAPRLTGKALSGILRDVGTMTSAGIPIISAVQAVWEEAHQEQANSPAARFTEALHRDIASGSSVLQAFSRSTGAVPASVLSLIRVGEETGTLDRMMLDAAQHVQRIETLMADAKQAMIYPAFVFASILAVAAFWIVYVIPNLTRMFKQMNVPLPALTLFLMDFSSWAVDNIFFLTVVSICAGVFLLQTYQGVPSFRRMCHNALHRIPILRTIVTSSGLAFMTEHLNILVRAGVDLLAGLRILEQATNDLYYRERITAIQLALASGERLGSAMRMVGGFPPMLVRMVSVGEDTGTLADQLEMLSVEYRQRFSRVVGTIGEIIKPLVIIVAGAVFIVLLGAFLLPIYELIGVAMNPTT